MAKRNTKTKAVEAVYTAGIRFKPDVFLEFSYNATAGTVSLIVKDDVNKEVLEGTATLAAPEETPVETPEETPVETPEETPAEEGGK